MSSWKVKELIVLTANEKGGLGESKQEAHSNKASKVLDSTCACADAAPDHHDATEVPGRSDLAENHVTGDLAENVSDEENRERDVVLLFKKRTISTYSGT